MISQNRMAEADDKRADLNLQISLLSEHETTQILTIVAATAAAFGVQSHRLSWRCYIRDCNGCYPLTARNRASSPACGERARSRPIPRPSEEGVSRSGKDTLFLPNTCAPARQTLVGGPRWAIGPKSDAGSFCRFR